MKISRGLVEGGDQGRAVEEAVGQDVDDFAFPLEDAVGLEEGGVAGDGAEAFVDGGPENEVCDAGFVFEGDEYDAGCGAGALADEHEAGDGDAGAVGVPDGVSKGDVGDDFELGEGWAGKGDGVAFQREAGGAVVGEYFLDHGHFGEGPGRD